MYRNIYHSLASTYVTSSWALVGLCSLWWSSRADFSSFWGAANKRNGSACEFGDVVLDRLDLFHHLSDVVAHLKKEVYEIWSKGTGYVSIISHCLRTTNVFSPGNSCLTLRSSSSSSWPSSSPCSGFEPAGGGREGSRGRLAGCQPGRTQSRRTRTRCPRRSPRPRCTWRGNRDLGAETQLEGSDQGEKL